MAFLGLGSAGFLVQICFLVSSLWLVTTLAKHSLTDQPRLSSTLLLLFSGIFTFSASLASRWLPGSHVKHSSGPVQREQALSLTQGPQRNHVAIIVILIALRLEIFQRVMYEVQCSGKGIEAFLPMLLAAHEFIVHQAPPHVVPDEPPDVWGSLWDDIKQWMKESPISLLASSGMISFGVLLSMDLLSSSTYFCSTVVDSQPFVVLIQFVGVIADAAIIILTRELLSSSESTKTRLRALGSILLAASLLTTNVSLLLWFLTPSDPADQGHFRGITSVYLSDIFSSSILISVVLVSLMLWTFEAGPLIPAALATFLCGFLISVQHTFFIGSFEQVSPNQPPSVMALLFLGLTIFLYSTKQRHVARIRRVFIVVVGFAILMGSTTFSLLRRNPFGRHTVDELVYSNRVESDRWLRYAMASDSLKSAIVEYRERHHGRDPPPNFDKWYQFAMERKSVIIDMFDQIEKDILPFWGMQPQRIRDGLEVLRGLPDVGIITIDKGVASHNQANSAHKDWLDDMVGLISDFSTYLPDMKLAFNLATRPKILTPWEDIHRFTEAGQAQRVVATEHVLEQRAAALSSPDEGSENPMSGVDTFDEDERGNLKSKHYISAKTFRRLQALACPPGSRTRIGLDEGVRDFCSSCAHPHSKAQFLSNWQRSLDHCHQPDIFSLHEFFTIPHQSELFQDLLPLFSTSKTNSFNDILVPSPHDEKLPSLPEDKFFDQRVDLIYWQGDFADSKFLTPKSHHGSHRNRLVHMVNNATTSERVVFLVGWKSGDDEAMRYNFEDVPARSANGPLPWLVSFSNKQGCTTEVCRLLESEFGSKAAAGGGAENNHRYTIILDTQDGPSPDFLPTMRSRSRVPVMSSIFRTWYTERLQPWAHFIPIDPRYHALHSTMAYFTGLSGRGPLNGKLRDGMDGRAEDARWIAEAGGKWAEKVLRREDMAIYMFRLLLEWGRVTDDRRNELGFRLPEAAKPAA